MIKRKLLKYRDFKALLSTTKSKSDPIWCSIIFRPISFPMGWVLYKIGVTANAVSFFSIFLTIVSCVIIVFGGGNAIFFASLLMLIVSLSDCIDGNIARARGDTGPFGEWLDALSGYIVYAFLPLSIGIHLSLQNSGAVFPGFWIVIGALTAISNLLFRLAYQKYINTMAIMIKTKDKNSRSFFFRISGEFGLVGWMMPALCISLLFNILELYLAFYCFFYLASFFAVLFVLVRRTF
jgi:phosphatidylglycerophosphate synthase